MFFHKKKEKLTLSEPTPDISSYRIQVMPQQFLPEMMKSVLPKNTKEDEFYASIEDDHKGINKTKLVGGIIIALAGIGIIAGVFYLYQSSFGAPAPQNIVSAPVVEKEIPSSQSQKNSATDKEEPIEKKEKPVEQIAPTPTITEDQNQNLEKVGENIEVSQLPIAPDEDNDFLSDVEETLYGSDATEKDTDGDGYSDGEEIHNLYNPNGKGSLKETGLITKFTDAGYEIWYPSLWTPEKNVSGASLFFRAGTGEMIQILLSTKETSETVVEWYQKQNPTSSIDVSSLSEIQVGELSGLSSPDRLTTYLSHQKDPKTVFVIFYNPVDQEILRYQTTFQMMLRSFSLL